MEISHKKFAALKAASHRGGKAVLSGGKAIVPTLRGAGVGAAARLLETFGKQKVQFLVDHWYAAPAALLLLGHVAKRKPKLAADGQALIGAAGYAAMIAYQRQAGGTGGLLNDVRGVGDVADAGDDAGEDAGAMLDAYAPQLPQSEASGVGDAATAFYAGGAYEGG
jgi:hypothetical protein